jgi:proteic killer suppression protein
VIESFRDKGRPGLFEQDGGRRPKADQPDRLRLILSALDQASDVQDVKQPTIRLNPLKGNRKGVWSETVRANWRVTYRFVGGDAYDMYLEDYHYWASHNAVTFRCTLNFLSTGRRPAEAWIKSCPAIGVGPGKKYHSRGLEDCPTGGC